MPRFPHPLVVFDLDGTLADTLPATYRCFKEAVAPVLGRHPTDEEIRARMGAADHRIIAEWVGPGSAGAAVARLYACYERELARTGPFPGIPGLLMELRARGRRTALFTGRGRPSTDRLLQVLGMDALFETTVTGEEVAHPKPAPDGILEIARRLGVAPRDAVYVGDSVLDVRSARGAGAAVIAARWGTREAPALIAEGVPVAPGVAELRAWLLGEGAGGA